MTKIDPYNTKEKYLSWKEKTQSDIKGISGFNFTILKQYLHDMETGLNVASSNKKGSRSYIRLNVLRQRLVFIMKELEIQYSLTKITEIKESQLFNFFNDLRNGTIKRKDGKTFKSAGDFVKDFKAFWHWWMKINRKKEINILDMTLDLDTTKDKPDWVYLTEEQVKKLCVDFKFDYKVLVWFLFDTGIRAPTELMNIRVSDFYNNFKELNIRDEISKTFGRRIKLMICSDLIREYVKKKELKGEDYLFTLTPSSMNKYLKRAARRLFGDEKSPAGEKYANLSMYDFRHISCCYWLPRYKSESALKYRFGWKKSDKIHYYSELLGMRDTISEEDMLVDISKLELEKRIEKTEKENAFLKEDNELMKVQIAQIGELTKILYTQMKINMEVGV